MVSGMEVNTSTIDKDCFVGSDIVRDVQLYLEDASLDLGLKGFLHNGDFCNVKTEGSGLFKS